MTTPTIRPARQDDTAAVYNVCLRTAADGDDATGRYANPDLLGHIWAGPYLALQPQYALVLEDDEGVAGYTLGALDSRAFEQLCAEQWWPSLQRRIKDPLGGPASWSPDQRLAHLVHHPPYAPEPVVARYPSHLHIDLLPRGQGKGHGRTLIESLLDLLRAEGSGGVHLGVSPTNVRAQGFYRALGFVDLQARPNVLFMGRDIPPGDQV